MVNLVRVSLMDGPLSGKWRMLQTDSGGLPPEYVKISGLLGVSEVEGGVHRCVVYRREGDELPGDGKWSYSYDHDEPYRPFPPGLAAEDSFGVE